MIGDSKQAESRKERLAPKHYSPYLTISKNSKTLHGRGCNYIQSTTSMPKYNYIVFSFISRYPHSCAAVIHKSALYYSILCTELCTILWITLRKREIHLKLQCLLL